MLAPHLPFFLINVGDAGDRYLKRNNRLDTPRKGQLYWTSQLSRIRPRRKHCTEGADVVVLFAKPPLQIADLASRSSFGLRIVPAALLLRVAHLAGGFAGFSDQGIQRSSFLHEDLAVRATNHLHVVPDLALQANVSHQALIGLGIEARQVAGVGITVRIAVRDVEQVDEIVAILDRAHGLLLVFGKLCRVGSCDILRSILFRVEALVVIANRETPLIPEWEIPRQIGTNTVEDLANFLLVPNGGELRPLYPLGTSTFAQIREVMSRTSEQQRENRGWAGRGRTIVAITYGCVDIAERSALNTFEHGEQSAKSIGCVRFFAVQTHWHILLLDTFAEVPRKAGLADRCAHAVDSTIGAHAHDDSSEQGAGVTGAAQDRAHQFA